MVPTRADINNKISTLQEDKLEGITQWLDEIECPAEDKEKILSDLVTYDNY